jgi:hypothetical protein
MTAATHRLPPANTAANDPVFVHGYGFIAQRIEVGPRWSIVEDHSGRRWAVPSNDCESMPGF